MCCCKRSWNAQHNNTAICKQNVEVPSNHCQNYLCVGVPVALRAKCLRCACTALRGVVGLRSCGQLPSQCETPNILLLK